MTETEVAEPRRKQIRILSGVASDVRLDYETSPPNQPDCRVLKHGEKLRPMPWDGYTCNVHVPPGCKGNAYLGPGEFRLVIHTCNGKSKFVGPSFQLGKL